MRKLRVLIACEESQTECKAFREMGCEAYSCDIQPCKKNGVPNWHIMQDVTPLLDGTQQAFRTLDGVLHVVRHWDVIVAHPPCTYLCRLSSCQLYIDGIADPERLVKMQLAREFFFKCLNAKADYVAVENPIPMKRAQLPRPSCYVQPSWFGHKYTKKTLYWLRGLPPLMAGAEFPNPKCYVRCSRGKYRSRTFEGVAMAMASQWVSYIESIRRKMP